MTSHHAVVVSEERIEVIGVTSVDPFEFVLQEGVVILVVVQESVATVVSRPRKQKKPFTISNIVIDIDCFF